MDELVKNGLVFELSGGLLVDTAGNNAITNSGATLVPDHNGRANRGFAFDGVNDNIEIPINAFRLNINNTIIVATKSNDLSTQRYLITEYLDDNNYWTLSYVESSRIIFFHVVGGVVYSRQDYFSASNLNNWSHIAVVLKSGDNNSEMYINGNKVVLNVNTNNGLYNDFNRTIKLAQYRIGIPFFIGDIDKTQFFSRALSESEIKKLYNEWRSH